MRNAIRLGKILGIEIGLDYSWFIIFFLVTWSLAGEYFPRVHPGWSPTAYWVMAGVTALLFFASWAWWPARTCWPSCARWSNWTAQVEPAWSTCINVGVTGHE